MHIQYQHRSLVVLDQSRQHDARQEGFSSPSSAKHPGRALHEFLQVQAHRQILLPSVADDEVFGFFAFTEYFGNIPGAGPAYRGVVRRHGFNRHWAALSLLPKGKFWAARVGPTLQHERRQNFQVGVQGLAVQQPCQPRRQASLALLVGKARVGCAELQVGYQAIKLPVAALNDHEGAFLDILRWDGQPHAQVFFQAAANHIADLVVGI